MSFGKLGSILLVATLANACVERPAELTPSRPTPSSAGEVLAQIPQAKPAAAARFSVAASVSIDRPGEFTPIYRGGGVIDFVREEVSADLRFNQPRPTDLRFIVDVTGIFMKGTADVRLKLPTGSKWLLLEPRDFRRLDFDVFSFLHGDPAQEFRFLARQARRVQDFGTHNVRGALVGGHHFRITVDLAGVKSALRAGASDLSSAARDYFRWLVPQLGKAKTFIKDAWIDGSGNVIRDVMTISITLPKGDATFRQVFDYFDYGDPNLYVNPPPPGDFSV